MLEKVLREKHLGVTIDCKLNLRSHGPNVNIATRNIGIIFRTDKVIFLNLYNLW